MVNQQTFQPENLSPSLMAALTRLTKEAGSLSPDDCLKRAKDHLEQAASLAASKPTVNMALASRSFIMK